MRKLRAKTVEIRQLIIDAVANHPDDLVAVVASAYQMTPQGVAHHIRSMVDAGILQPHGNTKSRRYTLNPINEFRFTLDVKGLEEHVPWEQRIRPALLDVPENIRDVCAYGFTEMLNNVIDHSESSKVAIGFLHTAHSVRLTVEDRGVGIFKKIKRALKLEYERQSIMELAKGKLTTDPDHHTGEGVFFTSRIFDVFDMSSGSLFFTHSQTDEDWLIESQANRKGTRVQMSIGLTSQTRTKDVFDKFSGAPEEMTFSKTHVPLKLAQFGSDNLVSRSQARRVLGRVERFEEVLLDFADVPFVGQAFADEIFRVFQNRNPQIRLIAINANEDVGSMVQRARLAYAQMKSEHH